MNVQPFKVEVSEAALDDLRARLARTRWPDEIEDVGWDYGTSLSYLKELVDYWQKGFDWRVQEAAINRLSHFRVSLGGLGIHFVHERGQGRNPLPLVITHGWPSTFYQMHKLTALLTDPAKFGADPADSFDVVVPSLPGYGFSDRPAKPGMNKTEIARLWARLMTEALGYNRFGAQGGDVGTGITTRLGLLFPERLAGIHLTDPAWPYLGEGARALSEAERAYVEEEGRWQRDEGAYGDIHATKPQTLAYGLNDSPSALAAWIIEKFRAWSDCAGDVERRFTKDELLTNLTIYWVTETINSSIRIYYESRREPAAFKHAGERVTVPTALAIFPADIDHPPREWAERSYNLTRWTLMPRGGHFAALEEPELLAQDIRSFFRPLR
ncbi:MAG TPA: epoxide hydrolase [Pyrinomonadaceae bacterium]|jgi:pimeloyl-ACP methyl ester carboxylesterase|nr:epoxide hydrolase [Pyrinomonadaceae bacterium]